MRQDARDDLRSSLQGVMVPLVTPFDEALDIDWPAFDRHVEALLAAGVRVLLAADLVGEAWALTIEEKAALFERTVRVARGRAIVVAKLSEPALRSTMRLAAAARDAGVDAVKVVLPAAVAADEDETYDYLLTAGHQTGQPFLVETNGPDIPPAVLDRLIEHPALVGIEETSTDLDRLHLLVERYGARVPVIAGSEDALGFTLLLGARGFMTASPNFAPTFMEELWQRAAARDAANVLELYGRLRRFRRLFQAELRAGRPAFVTYAKGALEVLGRPVGPPRPPLRRLSRPQLTVLSDILRDALDLDVGYQQGSAER